MNEKTVRSAAIAVIYTRVSSQEQVEQGTSLESQEQACLKKAESIGARVVVPAFRDEGVSGATYVGRPGLQAALALIEQGEADTLVCYDVSRLSRDVEHHAIIARRVKQARGRIVFCTQDFADTADGELSAGILKQFAQWEKRKIRERTQSGHKRQAERGIQTYRNLSPMGYHVVTAQDVLIGQYPVGTQGTYCVLEAEADTVRELFRRAAAGSSLSGLAAWLDESGIPTRQGGKGWRQSTVRAILKNPVYMGEVLVGRKEVVSDESRREQGFKMSYYLRDRDREDCVRITVPALVTPQLWEVVQERLEDNKARLSGRKSRRFALSGLFRCPACGNRCSVAHKQGKSHTYFCRQKRVCHPHAYGGQTAEQAVYAIVQELAERPELVETALRAYAAKPETEGRGQIRGAVLRDLAKLQEREKATVTAQIAGIQAGADPGLYEGVFAEIAAQRKELQTRLAALEKQDDETAFAPADSSVLLAEALSDMETALFDDLVQPAEKNALLSSVVRGVYPLNREGDYRVDLCPLPGSGLTLQQTLSWCQLVPAPSWAGLRKT